MRILFSYWLFISILFFTSCEEEIFFSDKSFQPKIVVNSIFTPDSAWVIKLTHTTSIFNNSKDQDNYIDDAKILITDQSGQGMCDFYYQGKGVYLAYKCRFNYESEFNIFVSSKKYGSVNSSSNIPQKSSIEYVKVKEDSRIENANEIEFQIKDKNIDKKYYIWSIVTVDSVTGLEKDTLNNTVSLDIKNWVKSVNDNAHLVKTGKLNSSLALTGVELEASDNKTSVFTTQRIYREGETKPQNTTLIPMLRLMTVSEDLYQYYKSLEDYLKYNNNSASVIEPQKIYTNIQGGYGIFAGYSIQYIPIQ